MTEDKSSATYECSPVVVVVTLRRHLANLEAREANKLPNQQRKVPGIPQLAAAAGVTRQTMHNIATGRIKMINLKILSAIINELRRCGFPTDVVDLLTTYPSDSVSDES